MFRKLNITTQDRWPHHRFGWPNVLQAMHRDLHDPLGVTFIDAVEEEGWGASSPDRPWVGFLHQPHSLARAAGDLGKCVGLWVMTEDMKRRLGPKPFPVSVIKYAINPAPAKRFHRGYTATLAMVGHCNRMPSDFIALKAKSLRKIYVVTPDVTGRGQVIANMCQKAKIDIVPSLSAAGYDDLLAFTYIFLPLSDMGGCTALNECIAAGTPVLVPRLPAAIEYLGASYPLFYDSLDHAAQLIEDINLGLGVRAHEHLMSMDKADLDIATFTQRFEETEVYRAL